MRHTLNALIATSCLLFATDNAAPAQVPPTATIAFTNRSDVSVIVKGYTVVNGVQRSGQPLALRKTGGKAFEINVPLGVRFYSIHDANQPGTILLRNFPVPVQNREVVLAIVPSRTNPNQLVIVADK